MIRTLAPLNPGQGSPVPRRPIALTIAGSDSGGGSGIQADLKTFQAFGVFGCSAITAITAQNTLGVRAIQRIDAARVADQIHAVAEDLRPAAAKSGMLADAEIIRVVTTAIQEARLEHYILDPVIVAKSGDQLLEADAVGTLAESLLPLAEVVTPNMPEAALLAERPVHTVEHMMEAAEALVQRGARAALVKGGHLEGDTVVDVYYDGQRHQSWESARIETRHTHGTGCTLSAAICAGLARGWPRLTAVERAREFTRRAIETAPGIGAGHGPLNHWASVEFEDDS